ncbi:HNH nuclease [Candidatus Nanopelagicaceae bacterium]
MSTNAARVTEISLAHSFSEFDSETGEIFASTESKGSENYGESSDSTGCNLDSEDRGSIDRFQETLDSRATELLNSVPGIETLTALVAIDPEDLSRGARVDYLSAVERQTGWLQALIQRAIVAVAGSEPSQADGIYEGVDDAEREDISAALRMSGNSAQYKIDIARSLINTLPNTCSALATGEISPAHANVIARETAAAIREGLPVEAIARIEESAIAHAEFHTPAQVGNKVRTMLAQVAPKEFEEIVVRARETRKVSMYRESDGMATVVAILPAEDAQTVMSAIENFVIRANRRDEDARNHAAKAEIIRATFLGRAPSTYDSAKRSSGAGVSGAGVSGAGVSGAGVSGAGVSGAGVSGAGVSGEQIKMTAEEEAAFAHEYVPDFRTMDMKRADALSEIAGIAVSLSEDEAKSHRRSVSVNVTIDLPTLLGLNENPGQLAGYGALPAQIMRALAGEGKWRRFITDPNTGTLLDYGRDSYQPPQDLVDYLIARDRTCRFPGCRQSAARADIDHAEAWEDGGETSAANLGALCRRHHRMKTHGGWKLTSNEDGSCNWESPDGHRYFVPARPIMDAV